MKIKLKNINFLPPLKVMTFLLLVSFFSVGVGQGNILQASHDIIIIFYIYALPMHANQ